MEEVVAGSHMGFGLVEQKRKRRREGGVRDRYIVGEEVKKWSLEESLAVVDEINLHVLL
jgi:hypothetical protein